MVNQKSNQTKQKLFGAIPLCSRCIVHEMNNWLADKRGEIDLDASQKVSEELKDIKLRTGECVVCNHNLISDSTFENILKVFDKHKVNSGVIGEFKKLFGFVV